MNTICDRIRQLRAERGMTQTELAEALNLVQQTVSDYENPSKKAQPGYDVMLAMADFFCVSLDYLSGRSDVRSYEIYENVKRSQVAEVELLNQYKSLPPSYRDAIKTLITGYLAK